MIQLAIEKLKNFGAKKSQYSDAQTISALSVFESQVGPVSVEYKAILLYFGGDIEFDDRVIYAPFIRNPWSDDEGYNRLAYLYGLRSQYASGSLIEKHEIYRDRVSSDVLVIGESPGGNQICLGLNGNGPGKVFFWDHEGEIACGAVGSHSTNLYLISMTFEKFVASLEKDASSEGVAEGVVLDLQF